MTLAKGFRKETPRADESAQDQFKSDLAALPSDWLPALLPIGNNKRPHDPATGRRTGWPDWPAFSPEALSLAPAVGLRLGPISGGTLAIDFDGPESKQTWARTYGTRTLPKSIAWTSGKPDRQQIAFKVPTDRWAELEHRKAAEGALEFRWAGQQSVIMGAHPETDGYSWVAGCAPWEVELAEAPAWLLDLMPRKTQPPPPLLEALEAAPTAAGAPVPFREFISRDASELIDTGSSEGSCNEDGLRLSMELVAVEAWLQAQCAAADESARDAFACYISHCPDTIGGAAFDTRAAWFRFDGAADQHPSPSTPEDKLLSRLAFHRRKATSKVVPISSKRPRKQQQPAPAEALVEEHKEQQEHPSSFSKPLTMATHAVLLQLPQRIGQPRLNIRTRDVHLPDRILSGDEAARLYLQLSNNREKWPKETTFDAVQLLAEEASFDPVAEYLEGLEASTEPLAKEEWNRLDLLLFNIDDPVAAAFLTRFFITAVARTFQPGCIGRQWPVLIGEKGIGKSDLPKLLFNVPGLPEGFVDNPGDLQRDGLMKAHRSWCVELAELNGISRRADKEHVKAFLSERVDTYRAPYSRAPASHKRRFVFWGTSNGPPMNEADPRFVCIPLPDRMLPFAAVEAARDALWARAMAEYRAGTCWHTVSDQFKSLLKERNEDHTVTDPWAEQVAEYLVFRHGGNNLPVSVPDLMTLLKLDSSQRNNAAAVRLIELAGSLGWVKGKRRPAPGLPQRQGLWPKDWK